MDPSGYRDPSLPFHVGPADLPGPNFPQICALGSSYPPFRIVAALRSILMPPPHAILLHHPLCARRPCHLRPLRRNRQIPHLNTVPCVSTEDHVSSCADKHLLTVDCASDPTRGPSSPPSLTSVSDPPGRPRRPPPPTPPYLSLPLPSPLSLPLGLHRDSMCP